MEYIYYSSLLAIFSSPHLRKKFRTKWQLSAVKRGGSRSSFSCIDFVGCNGDQCKMVSPTQDLKTSEGGNKTS